MKVIVYVCVVCNCNVGLPVVHDAVLAALGGRLPRASVASGPAGGC